MTDSKRIAEILKAYTKKNNISASSVILEEYADELLANGVIVQKEGEWQDNHNGTFTCSVCGSRVSKMNYCGNCSAKLKELGK
jgi:hypothetical protein